MRPLLLAVTLIAVIACNRTPDEVSRFEYDPSWEQRIVDPGIADVECRAAFETSVCGCADFSRKIVFLSRQMNCTARREKTKKHEACHVRTGPSKAAVAKCHEEFPPETVFQEIRR